MNLCQLCLENESDKKNSHIVPKFMGSRLFNTSKSRYTLQINQKGRSKKIQDTPKVDYLICSNCETRISILETLFSKKLASIHDFKNQKQKFTLKEKGTNKILTCHNVHPIAFKLFIYSILWRISICDHEIFNNFQLPTVIESELREFINNNLKNTHKELINSFSQISLVPKFDFIIYKPLIKNEHSRGILSAYQLSEEIYGLFTVDLAIHFYTNKKSIVPILKTISNNQNEAVYIALADLTQWNTINMHVVNKLLKNRS